MRVSLWDSLFFIDAPRDNLEFRIKRPVYDETSPKRFQVWNTKRIPNPHWKISDPRQARPLSFLDFWDRYCWQWLKFRIIWPLNWNMTPRKYLCERFEIFLNLLIFIPGWKFYRIERFLSREFWIFKIWDFYHRRLGTYENLGDFFTLEIVAEFLSPGFFGTEMFWAGNFSSGMVLKHCL